MKDLFKKVGLRSIGPGGLNCPCCDSGLSSKRKSKINRNDFSQLKRARLKRLTRKEFLDDA